VPLKFVEFEPARNSEGENGGKIPVIIIVSKAGLVL
jgi:hypothetical protein